MIDIHLQVLISSGQAQRRSSLKTKYSALTVVLAAVALSTTGRTQAPHSIEPAAKPVVPRTWDDSIMPTLEVPLSHPVGSPKPVSADYYYKIPVRPIYKQYPVYAPGREPVGYMEWLKKQDPVILWDDAKSQAETRDRSRLDQGWRGRLHRASLPSEAGDQGIIAIADIKSTAWYEKEQYPRLQRRRPSIRALRHPGKRKDRAGQLLLRHVPHTRNAQWEMPSRDAQGNFPFERIDRIFPPPSASDAPLTRVHPGPLRRTLAASRSAWNAR